MIPNELQSFETYIVSYSGGKDSTAMLLWALENLPRERLRVMHNSIGDIGPPENAEYLPYIEDKLGVTIEFTRAGDRPLPPLRNGKRRQSWQEETSFLKMVRARGMWPDWKNRYCTVFLKQWPTVLWAIDLPHPVVNLTGQRKAESKKRQKLTSFSEEREWKQTRYGLPVYRPILEWSEDDVWQMMTRHDILPNPVYNRSSRCNCGLCFQARRCEVLNFCRLYPDVARQAVNLEREIEHTWKERCSIASLFKQAQAQMELFTIEPRFPNLS